MKTLSGMMLTLLLIGMLALTFNIQPVKASGTIYIRADGSIEGTTNITTADNVTYTLNATINDPIVVERNNIIIDGAGHTVNGPGTALGLGFNLTNINNATIKNTQIKQFNYGVYLRDSSNNTLSGNNITNNYYGVNLSDSSNNTLSGNNITNNYYGVDLVSSSGNMVSGNNITNNYRGGVDLSHSSDNNTLSGNNITNNQYGVNLRHSSDNNTVSGNVFVGDGLYFWDSFGSVVVDNLVNGKPLVYFEGVSDVVVEDAGQVILVNCNRIKVENLNLSHTSVGVDLYRTNSTTLTGNDITNNDYGGVNLRYSSNNTLSGNNITNNQYGVNLYSFSDNNTVSGNNITNNQYGVNLGYSSNNRFYHNNLINNTEQVYVETSGHANFWDNGLEGNYWSDYVRFDLDRNGIGDSAYEIDADNIDNYPMMGIFSDFSATSEYHVQTICNSSLSDFQFNGTAICFNATGENDTIGFCRICIPRALMNETYKVFVNGTEVPYNLLPCSNSTHSYLYFDYEHSTQEVVIISEFPLALVLPLFMMAILLTVILYKTKNSKLSIATAMRLHPIHQTITANQVINKTTDKARLTLILDNAPVTKIVQLD